MHKFKWLIFSLCLIGTLSCKKEEMPLPANGPSAVAQADTAAFTIGEVKAWLAEQSSEVSGQQSTASHKAFSITGLPVDWSKMQPMPGRSSARLLVHLPGRPVVDSVPQGYRKLLLEKNKAGKISARILEIVPDALYIQQKQGARNTDFSGKLFIYDQGYHLQKGYIYHDGQIIGEIRLSQNTSGGMHTNQVQVIQNCQWHDSNYVDAEGVITIYSQKVCTFDTYDDGMDMPVTEHPNTVSGTDYLGSGGGGGGGAASAPPVANLPDEGKPAIDARQYVQCFGNVPDAGAKMKVTVYVQQPFPGTTFNVGPNSVGHVAIGLTKINGSQVVNQVMGFYPDATGSAKMHAPGKLNDNGNLDYNVSITYEVGAGQFQSIINYIANPPATYDLVSFNCTSFVFTAVKAGGIDLPDPLTRVGPEVGPFTAYAMTPAGLGESISKLNGQPNVQTNSNRAPFSKGPCK